MTSFDSSIDQILSLGEEFFRTSDSPFTDILQQKNKELQNQIQFLYQKIIHLNNSNETKLHIDIIKCCETIINKGQKLKAKDTTIWFFLHNLCFQFLSFSTKPSEEEYKSLMGLLKKLTDSSKFLEIKDLQNIGIQLCEQLIYFFQEATVKYFLLLASVEVRTILFDGIKLKNCFIALTTYLDGVLTTIKDVCNSPETGPTFGPALIKFLINFEISDNDPQDDTIIPAFYKKIIPQSIGKARQSALIRRLISLATATCSKQLFEKVLRHIDILVEGLKSDRYYLSTLYIIIKIYKVGITDVPIEPLLDCLRETMDVPILVINELKHQIDEHFKDKSKDLYNQIIDKVYKTDRPIQQNIQKIALKLANQEKYQELRDILNFQNGNRALIPEVLSKICELMAAGLKKEKIYNFCVNDKNTIVPIIAALEENIQKYYNHPICTDLFDLLCMIIDYSTTLKDERELNTQINFMHIDALGYIFLLDEREEIVVQAISLMQNVLKLYSVIKPSWKTVFNQQHPAWSRIVTRFNQISKKKLLTDASEMLIDETDSQLQDSFDIGDFLRDNDNRINFVCELCAMQARECKEFKDSLTEKLLSLQTTGFCPQKFALLATNGISEEEVNNMLQNALDNIDATVIIGISNVSKRIRESVLTKLQTVNCNIDQKIKILSFTLQKMVSNKRNIVQEHLHTIFEILMSNNILTNSYSTENPITETTINFLYAILIVIKNINEITQTEKNYLISLKTNLITLSTFLHQFSKKNQENKFVYSNESILIMRVNLQIALLIPMKINEISSLFQQISKLIDSQPSTSTYKELSTFYNNLKTPELIEQTLKSLAVITSPQNVIIFSIFSLKYIDNISKKNIDFDNILFYSILADELNFLDLPSIRDLLSNNNKILSLHLDKDAKEEDIKAQDSVSAYFCKRMNPKGKIKMINLAIDTLKKTPSTRVMLSTISLLEPWLKETKFVHVNEFIEAFSPLFDQKLDPIKRKAIICRVFLLMGHPKMGLTLAMKTCVQKELFDDETWNAFAIIDPLATFYFVISCLRQNIIQPLFFSILNELYMKETIKELNIVIAYSILLETTSQKILNFIHKTLIETFSIKKDEKFSSLMELLNQRSSGTKDSKTVFNMITSFYPQNEVLKEVSSLIAFNPSELLFSYILSNKENITKEVINNLILAFMASTDNGGDLKMFNFILDLAPKFFEFNEIENLASVLIQTDSKEFCESILSFMTKCNEKSQKFLDLAAKCAIKGLISLENVQNYAKEKSLQNSLLSFLIDKNGEIDTNDLILTLYYGDEKIIQLIAENFQNIHENQLKSIIPLIIPPNDQYDFIKIFPFVEKISNEMIEQYSAFQSEIILTPEIAKGYQISDPFVLFAFNSLIL